MLFLLVLGAASVKAQVRIGGNAAPQGAAVLDLNADNTISPAANKGGLSLPRVSLDSTTMKLNGIAPIAGTLVWNTNGATLGGGVCHWNGSSWVRTSLPMTNPGDSGKFLMSNGKIWVPSGTWTSFTDSTVLHVHPDTVPIKWTRVLDTSFYTKIPPYTVAVIRADGLLLTDECSLVGRYQPIIKSGQTNVPGYFVLINNASFTWDASTVAARVRCIRPDR